MKKFLAVILSLVMVLSLASCNMEGGYKVNKDGSLDVSLCIEFDSQEFNNYMALESMTSGVDLGGYVSDCQPECSQFEFHAAVCGAVHKEHWHTGGYGVYVGSGTGSRDVRRVSYRPSCGGDSYGSDMHLYEGWNGSGWRCSGSGA